MIDFIKTYLRNKKINAFRARHKRTTAFVGFEKVRTILLLFDGTNLSRLGRVNRIIDDLILDGKTVKTLAFYDDKQLADICLTQDKIEFVCQRDFNWVGFPLDPLASDQMEKTFDLVLSLEMTDNVHIDTLLQMADATFKAGKAGILKDEVLDLVIEIADDKDETFLVEQIKYYLRNIRSKN